MKTVKNLLQNRASVQPPDMALRALKNRYAHYEALIGARCQALPSCSVSRRVIHPDRLRAAGW